MDENKYKSGFISIIGRPNVGKSTLLNTILNKKISIVTPKAQTTRDRINGIYNSDKGQLVFLDTPGYSSFKNKLNNFMNNLVFSSAHDCDILIFAVPSNEFIGANDRFMAQQLKKWNVPTILVITKSDLVDDSTLKLKEMEWKGLYNDFVNSIFISSMNKINILELINMINDLLPYSKIKYYSDDMITDRSNRFLIKELVREEILLQTENEVPHSCAVLIEKFENKKSICVIDVLIIVERKSQKAILIGKNGMKIKSIGIESRKKIEELLEKKVYLNTFVKVKEKWTRSDNILKKMGYDKNEY